MTTTPTECCANCVNYIPESRWQLRGYSVCLYDEQRPQYTQRGYVCEHYKPGFTAKSMRNNARFKKMDKRGI